MAEENWDEPTTGRKDVRLWPVLWHLLQLHLDAGLKVYAHLLIPGPEQPLGALNFSVKA